MKNLINKYNTFIKYLLSSGICLVLDLTLFTIFNLILKDKLGILSIFVSTLLARIISSCLNYFLNRNKVFKTDDNKFDTSSFIGYVLLVITQLCVSGISVTAIYKKLLINETVIKFGVDLILFLVNFVVQKYFIFNKEFKKKNSFILLIYAYLSTYALAVFPMIKENGNITTIRGKTILLAIICLGLYHLYKKYYNNIKYHKPFSILSLIYTIILIFGYSFHVCDSSYLVYARKGYLVLSIIKLFGYYIFINFVLNYIYSWLEKLEIKQFKPIKLKKYLDYFDAHPFKFSCIVLFIVYMVYFIAYYPGVIGYDPSYQIQEYMHIPTFYTDSATFTNDLLITQFNPVMHTLLIGFLFNIGHTLGNDNLGLAIYTFIQMMSLILTLSYTIKFMHDEKVNKTLIYICLIAYAVIPVFPFYAISAFKDTYYAIFFILFIVQLFKTIKYQMNKKDILLLIITAIGLCTFRHNGFVTVVITLLIYMLASKINRKQVLLSLMFIFLIHLCYNQVINYYEIAPTSIREVLSIPIQQTAALITNKEEVIEEEDKIIINKIIDYSIVKEEYNPELSDPIKNTFRKDVTNEELKEYFGVWFKYLLKEPKIYVEATVNNIYGYLYPESQKWYFYYKKYTVLNESDFKYHYIKKFKPLRKFLKNYGQKYQYAPILSLTTSIGFTTWIYLYLMVLLFKNNHKKYVLLLIPAFLTIAMCLVGPINTYYRYVIPYSMSLPFILSVLYNEKTNKIKEVK